MVHGRGAPITNDQRLAFLSNSCSSPNQRQPETGSHGGDAVRCGTRSGLSGVFRVEAFGAKLEPRAVGSPCSVFIIIAARKFEKISAMVKEANRPQWRGLAPDVVKLSMTSVSINRNYTEEKYPCQGVGRRGFWCRAGIWRHSEWPINTVACRVEFWGGKRWNMRDSDERTKLQRTLPNKMDGALLIFQTKLWCGSKWESCGKTLKFKAGGMDSAWCTEQLWLKFHSILDR